MAEGNQLPLTSTGPKPSPVPPSSKDPLSKDQWRTLYAFADTIVACIQPASHAKQNKDLGLTESDYAVAFNKIEYLALANSNVNLAKEYLMETPSENLQFRECIYRLLSEYIPKDLFDQLTLGLTLLK